MAMLSFGKSILLWSMGTREALLDAQGRTIVRECSVYIFCSVVTLEIFDRAMKNISDHSNQGLKMCEDFIFPTHWIEPCISRVLICKKHIIFEASER